MDLLQQQPKGALFGRALGEWRCLSRAELGLDQETLIIATGHQTLLWHPGILAKYLVVDSFANRFELATANLIVDQHAEGFGEFEIPIWRSGESLAVRKLELCRPRPRKEVPMGRHESFTPPRPPLNIGGAIPSVDEGVSRIFNAVYRHREAPNAALQMADALADLMSGWVRPMTNITSTALIGTSLARSIMREMVRDPSKCAMHYNDAVAQVPQAGIKPLLIRNDYVELPLWRIRDDGRRMHAYDNDVDSLLSAGASEAGIRTKTADLLPRALLMTALVRLAMCDLFVHGTGGAVYDRAMEIWIKNWLGIDVGSIAVASANLRLPLMDLQNLPEPASAIAEARRLWHSPSPSKATLLRAIESAPRNSPQRKALFVQMHERLASWRAESSAIESSQQAASDAIRKQRNAKIAWRRDWAFPLYPTEMLDELAALAERFAECSGDVRK